MRQRNGQPGTQPGISWATFDLVELAGITTILKAKTMVSTNECKLAAVYPVCGTMSHFAAMTGGFDDLITQKAGGILTEFAGCYVLLLAQGGMHTPQ